MVRKPFKRDEPEVPEQPAPQTNEVVIEQEINLSLLNRKINYLTSVVVKIAEACEVKLD